MRTIESIEMKTISAHDMSELSIRFNEWVAEEEFLASDYISSSFYHDGVKYSYTIVYKKWIKVVGNPNTTPKKVPEEKVKG